ncbi:MAG: transglycosylase SLT domain-containing protein [Candidatus Schekmanbacteria bacterium]|nr:transglycosylase SLT domain-containing protein [Candidatus Schekmanbacteria bacterium]
MTAKRAFGAVYCLFLLLATWVAAQEILVVTGLAPGQSSTPDSSRPPAPTTPEPVYGPLAVPSALTAAVRTYRAAGSRPRQSDAEWRAVLRAPEASALAPYARLRLIRLQADADGVRSALAELAQIDRQQAPAAHLMAAVEVFMAAIRTASRVDPASLLAEIESYGILDPLVASATRSALEAVDLFRPAVLAKSRFLSDAGRVADAVALLERALRAGWRGRHGTAAANRYAQLRSRLRADLGPEVRRADALRNVLDASWLRARGFEKAAARLAAEACGKVTAAQDIDLYGRCQLDKVEDALRKRSTGQARKLLNGLQALMGKRLSGREAELEGALREPELALASAALAVAERRWDAAHELISRHVGQTFPVDPWISLRLVELDLAVSDRRKDAGAIASDLEHAVLPAVLLAELADAVGLPPRLRLDRALMHVEANRYRHRAAAALLALGNPQRALAILDGTVGDCQNGAELLLHGYLRGRALEGLLRPDEAAAAYGRLLVPPSSAYFAVLASERRALLARTAGTHPLGDVLRQATSLAAQPSPSPSPTPSASPPLSAPERTSLGRIAALGAATETGMAIAELELLRRTRPELASHPWFERWIADLLLAGNDAHGARRQLGRLVESIILRNGLNAGDAEVLADRTLWTALFPAPSEHVQRLVEQLAPTRSLHPSEVYGVILQESGFQSASVSAVGATGLMQLMPATGSWVARKMGITHFKPRLLREDAMNIRFGSWYLASLRERFDGDWARALAAYNAGPGHTRRWWETWGAVDGDLFAELVPFDETRHFIRSVRRNQAMYRLLYGAARSEAS